MATSYAEKLKDPRWQKKRLEIMERDGWKCQFCYLDDEPLTVHHKYYTKGLEPWEYPDDCYVTLCEFHHELIHKWIVKDDFDAFDEVKYELENALCINKTDEILIARKIWNILHCNKGGFNVLSDLLEPHLRKFDIYNTDCHEVDDPDGIIEQETKLNF